jgi:hypothetical protein
MKLTRVLVLGGLAMAAACGTEQQRPGAATQTGEPAGQATGTELPPATPAPMDTGAMATGAPGASTGITLHALDNSGVTGDARLTEQGQQTMVMVHLTGATAQAQHGVHQGHIHTGSCEALGPVVVPLDPITTGADGTGEMTKTVDNPIATFTDGNHIVVYHVAGGSPGKPITCGAIPAGAM